ncbi:hypothetical protein Pcinc_014363 [Petrolisthes cinctipes]|uniref:Uncharacterized protein n=1 Tax=Petrolisthes cinctipes TaxID=88211 RepID=A0AAE1FX24_PETCI|nr:hypothetical protein Pcinc_014363 [Petrolisthes cinctipes]
MKLPAINVGSLTPLFTSSNQLLYHLAGWIVPGGDGFLCVNQVLDSRITNHCCIPAVYTGPKVQVVAIQLKAGSVK